MISIVIPIYNAEKYLHRCLDSILCQTYNDFEIILIDDGSNDESYKICTTYSQKDNRIKLYHKENGGVSSARNLGLEHINGEWITFIDADDWIAETYLENLIRYTKDDKYDLIFSYATVVHNDYIVKEKYYCKELCSDNIYKMFTENDAIWHTSPWSKLYKYSIIKEHKIQFQNGIHLGEDAIFLFQYIIHCNWIYITNHTDYQYNFDSENSLTKRIFNLESEYRGYEIIQDTTNQLKATFPNMDKAEKEFDWLIGKYIYRVLNSLYNENITRKKRIEIIKHLDVEKISNTITNYSYKERILWHIIKKKHIILYDCIRKAAKSLHSISL